MKLFVLSLFLLFILTGCHNSSTQNNNDIQIDRISSNVALNEKKEIEIATYSTTIYIKDSNRTNNISLTSSKINNITVEPNETFSFCDTVGKATPSKGYEKADIFDSEGNIVEGYGGGNCQVSSTLYNAVLSCSGLTIVERHEHSRDVTYVPEGKDAAVAYGSIDFKFKNENSYPIKIYSSNTDDEVTVRIVKIVSE